MNVDQLLREAAPDPDALRVHTDRRRADVLSRASSGRTRRQRRHVRVAVAGAVTALVGFGGAAYAAGTAPGWLTDLRDQFGEDVGVPAAQRPEMVQVVDLTMPDGSRFAAWRGVSDEMWCTAHVDQWDGRTFDRGRTVCSDGGPEDYDLNRTQVAWAVGDDGTTFYPVLLGDADDGAASVHVSGRLPATGEQVDLTIPVDPATQAFAGVLPGTVGEEFLLRAKPLSTGLVLEFLDANGEVLRTVDDLRS